MTKYKMIFSVNGYELKTFNRSNGSKQVTLFNTDGSLLASYPLQSGDNMYAGIEDCIIELRRFLKPATKLTFVKDNKDVEICIHWSKEHKQHRITFNKPNSKYNPSTAYEDSLTNTQATVAYIVSKTIATNIEYVLKLVDKLKINVATKRIENNW